MKLTKRDIEILKAVYSFGHLTCLQISLLFEMHIKVCQRRLRKLVGGDYMRRLPLPTVSAGRSPHLFYLGGEGEALLGVCSGKPRLGRETTHAMKNADIMIGVSLESRRAGLECEMLAEHLIRISEQRIIPDGAFCLSREENRALFLVENCAGTEIVRSPSFHEDVEAKIARYVELFERNDIGFYEEYFGCAFRRFRLLYITNNESRFKSISEIVLDRDIHGFVWKTTMGELKRKGFLGDVWGIPARGRFNVSITG